MRKIISKEEEGKRSKIRQLVVGTILVLILFLSIFGYSFGRGNTEDENSGITYNGYAFIEKSGFWITEIGDVEFSFKNSPNETEQINSNLKPLDNYYNKPLYILSDNMESSSEIYRNMNYLIKRMQIACLDEEECEEENAPIKNCTDNFIIIKEANVTEVIQEDNCVFIKGKKEDLVNITDGFLLKLIGVN
jgi:hypothetical protein